VKKLEKQASPAGPGQIIHEFPLVQTLQDAVYAMFIEDYLIPSFPANFFFYTKMSPTGFKDWYAENFVPDRGVTILDRTSWDRGCDAVILRLDTHIFERCGFSSQFIIDYVYRRTHSSCFAGPMGIVQNSGDRFTWPLNTVRNAVVTVAELDPPRDTALAFNGDDATADRSLSGGHCRDKVAFIDKVSFGRHGSFSGWTVGYRQTFFDPQALTYRYHIALARGTLDPLYWHSFADQLRIAPSNFPNRDMIVETIVSHLPALAGLL
jgi:hypothetical protein